MLKSFKSGNSNKNKKITIGDISNPTSNIPDTQLKNMNTISIQKAQMLQQKQVGNDFESFGHKDYSRVSSATSVNITGSGFTSSGIPAHSSDSSAKKSFVNRVTSEVSVKSAHSLSSSSNSSGGHLYGIVLYDFQAERNDELDCKAGENLVIFAHHENEWFIAKTIDRIGGPGLVPCGYVMVIDLATGFASNNDLEKDIESSSLPTVVEWKSSLQQQKSKNLDLKNNSLKSIGGSSRETNSYNSSINYNEISESVKKTNSANRGPITAGGPSKQTSESNKIYKNQSGGNHSSYSVTSSSNNKPIPETNNNSSPDDLDDDFILEANVTEYIWEDQKYKFIVKCLTSFSKERFLKRSYEDFYNLQINILESFPEESGKVILPDGKMSQRIVPYIPGPVPYVTEDITKKRLGDLNTYVNDLINLPNNISRSTKVLTLFQIQGNGFDTESEHNNHLRSISQGKFAESFQDQYKPQAMQEPDRHLQNIPEISANNLNANIFTSPDKKLVSGVSESNHGTLGVDDENTLKLQGLKISALDEDDDQKSSVIKKIGSQSALRSLSNNNSHLDDSPSKRPMKLTVNTQAENGMDKSQSNNTITDLANTPMTATFGGGKSVKIKFYYVDDIFALLLNSNITILELQAKILKKIDIESFKLFNKVGSSIKEEIKTDSELQEAIALKQKIAIVD